MEWVVLRDREKYDEVDELLKETIKSRFKSSEFSADLSLLGNPFLFKDMKRATECMTNCIKENKNICCICDFDVDGTTSAYELIVLITKLIKYLGSTSTISYYIPHRENEGYGVSLKAIDKIRSAGVSLIVTADCGITAVKEVAYAKELGIDFIVTDHHQYPKEVPNCPVVNPHDGAYPFTKLSGCATAFKFIEALYIYNGQNVSEVYSMIDIVAISTIADLVELVGENRTIVKYGLYLLQNNYEKKTRPWLNMLLDKVGFSGRITSCTVGFVIAPRLNSIGRLGDARNTVRFMLEEREDVLKKYVDIIEDLNTTRKKLQNDILIRGEDEVLQCGLGNSICVVTDAKVGIVGLGASNLTERFYRPSVVFTESLTDNTKYKASARSIEGFDFFSEVIEKNRDILEGGGHAMAAGFSIKKNDLDIFKKRFEMSVINVRNSSNGLFNRKLVVESELYTQDIGIDFLQKVNQMEPFGMGNATPIFCLNSMHIIGTKGVPKKEPKHLQLTLAKDGQVFKGIFFKRYDLKMKIDNMELIDIAFSLSLNEFAGKQDIQFIIEDFKEAVFEDVADI